MPRCSTCDHFYVDERITGYAHTCPPKWLAHFAQDRPEDARTIFANTAADAAADCAQQDDEENIGFTERAIIKVRRADNPNAKWQTFTVIGQLIPNYAATPED